MKYHQIKAKMSLNPKDLEQMIGIAYFPQGIAPYAAIEFVNVQSLRSSVNSGQETIAMDYDGVIDPDDYNCRTPIYNNK